MSKLFTVISELNKVNSSKTDKVVVNFMGGESYEINPLDTLKMITASSIFGELSYYRNTNFPTKKQIYYVDRCIKKDSVIPSVYVGKTTEQLMEEVIDAALDYDFKATLEWAVTLRKEFLMRLNPQIIMVRAALHPKRKEFTSNNKGAFRAYNDLVMSRPDEPMSQMAYYLYKNNGRKNNLPSLLKRSWADKMSDFTRYQIHKYKNHEIGMINAVRLCHANSDNIDELMTKGNIEIEDKNMTWENLRSNGLSWKEIFTKINMGHMALLRNLRGIFSEVDDVSFCVEVLQKLKDGVKEGKQFPFRYYSALKSIMNSDCNHKPLIIDALEECIDSSCQNMPKLKGRTMCLSDNSGSAWGAIPSEYGTVRIAEIDNLSSVIAAACSEEGYVGKFGDNLKIYPIYKRQGILTQTKNISSDGYEDVGGSTEGGIWKFFKNAINNKEHWDNIFIYSDQQAGHGGLYGTREDSKEYGNDYSYSDHGFCPYINVFALIQEYRKRVNPKVNVFSIQTAGYDNNLIPEYAYRTNIMYGWTGKELIFADEMIRQWNEIEKRNEAE
jgi:hypothetical protein